MKKSNRTEVIGVASGKGGVGKTTVAVNLAIALRSLGHRVMLFDADLGLANSQIALGCTCPFNLSHFMSGQKTLQEITVTSRQGVVLVPGASGVKEMASSRLPQDIPHADATLWKANRLTELEIVMTPPYLPHADMPVDDVRMVVMDPGVPRLNFIVSVPARPRCE